MDAGAGPPAAAAATSGAAGGAAPAADISCRLRQLAQQLDTHGLQQASDISQELQELVLQLQRHANSAAVGAATAATPVVGATPAATAAAAASSEAMVEALERSYAATSFQHVAQDGMQQRPLTKKQRRALGGPRVFDFSRHGQRVVALQLMYVGWAYQGFARQADSDNTIEGVLFPALRKVKLIPEDCEVASLAYSRCGRTDKGVSALGQVLALKLRSAAAAGDPLPPPDKELDYPTLINKSLPDTIRVLGWADVPAPDFSARFSCRRREYKYFILQDGSLRVDAMRAAAQHLLGEHDFRNFCKADVLQVHNYMRRVLSVSLEPVEASCHGMQVLALHITGTAFLWHQVRCIAAVLLMVGRGQEEPGIVQQLLDVTRVPCKPQYSMAAEEPLLLFRCGFDGLQWRRSATAVSRNLATVRAQLQQHLVSVALLSTVFEQLQEDWQEVSTPPAPSSSAGGCQAGAEAAAGVNGSSGSGSGSSSSSTARWVLPPAPHIPLLKRSCEPSIEERFAKAGLDLGRLNQPGGGAGGGGVAARGNSSNSSSSVQGVCRV